MGTDTMSDLNMGTDTASGIPIGNVQRETFNSQLSTGLPKWRMVAGNGDRHDIRPTGRDMGTDTMSDVPIRNVQRETLNSQLLTG